MGAKQALVIVDVQKAFNDSAWGKRNNLDAESNIKQLLTRWREKNFEVIHIQHISENPSSLFYSKGAGFPIKDSVAPREHEKIITKQVNSAFIGTHLDQYLKSIQADTIVIVGLTTPHCVSTTTRMSGNLGYKTFLISDATAAFGIDDHNGNYVDAETIHHLSLAAVNKEFATVTTTEKFIQSTQ
ncbi:cysteine hydrolase family protein [Virgibacillus sp. DJP39]|uniref:cysteine hydrolase family protein n=1 Tax=Virgibacillus sp. DJP39 TaxID=3409790 RepID=UPI003BB665AC